MAIKCEITWARKGPDDLKIQVTARRHGREWRFQQRTGRFENWEDLPTPPVEDWLELLDSIRRRIPRRLMTPDDERQVIQLIRERYPHWQP